jgi:SNF2 family DNA or RNA helicase
MKFNYKTEPYAHQHEALVRGHERTSYAYFMEMGCGKSKVLLDNIVWLYEQGKIDTAVIVAPKGVYRNWEISEIPAHFPDDIQREIYVWSASPNKKQAERLKDGMQKRGVLRIFLANVEGFASTKLPKFVGAFTKNSNFLLAVDESTTIKNPQAKRTKALVKLSQDAAYKRILTGSPVTKSPLDLYAQCGFMDKKLLGHDSYYSFQGRFAITRTQRMGAHSFQQIVGYRNLEELSDKLRAFSYRVTKEEALDLPDKIYTTRNVGLTEQQLEYYASIKSAAVAILEDGGLVTAPAAMTQLLRLQQVLCGHVMTDDGEMVEVPTKRLQSMVDCIDEMTGKVIIWSRFRYDIKKITETLKKIHGPSSTVSYFGDTSEQDRIDAVQSFQHGDARFFVANPQTAGYGLTLTAATNVIYYANDFNLETRVQSEDRAHRIGQKHSVLYVDLMTKNTVDEHIVKTLQGKIELSAQTLGEQVKKWLELSPRRSDD